MARYAGVNFALFFSLQPTLTAFIKPMDLKTVWVLYEFACELFSCFKACIFFSASKVHLEVRGEQFFSSYFLGRKGFDQQQRMSCWKISQICAVVPTNKCQNLTKTLGCSVASKYFDQYSSKDARQLLWWKRSIKGILLFSTETVSFDWHGSSTKMLCTKNYYLVMFVGKFCKQFHKLKYPVYGIAAS